MRGGKDSGGIRSLVAVLLLALASLSPVQAEQTLPAFYEELKAALSKLPDDPFDPRVREAAKQAVLKRYAGREIRIPTPTPGLDRNGNRQGIWPLRSDNGRLHLEFWPAQPVMYGPQLADSPLTWWRSDRSSSGGKQRASDGGSCRSYRERSGLGISAETPKRIEVFVDEHYGTAESSIDREGVSIGITATPAAAKRLSGRLSTYVRLDTVRWLQPPDAKEVRASPYRDCYSGSQGLIHARIDVLRISDRQRSEDLLRVKFRY